ncbi:adenylate/guanylate cyclase domain-containing protein [Leisingera caerulea]|uniref:adenylate/guanylate cyclase domain-containing protein n=1 Tax=Leisingera caerulea TaxID=506591 RepID=UPI0021A5769D|nr:adenylate/guanylate cyclase domain-containing protein [Leisingera caerulea]UWQ62207.1 adenylate/guanylate cyclase domain-containing protein [Leisingera caerulea]
MERRLAAILAADVVGYSRLIRNNEAGTLETVKTHRERLFEPIVSARGGRIVKLMGDGLLIEFASAVEAVRCAVEIQHFVGIENKNLPEDAQVRYRVGLNVGDIVVDQDDIQGDGVNIAARMESLADPAGICMSGSVFDQVKDKLDLTIEDAGMHQVKNMADPLHVFRLALDAKATALVSPVVRSAAKPAKRRFAVAIGVVLALALGVVASWQPWSPAVITSANGGKNLPATGKPSIAVMAFDNLNNDPSQDYLSDGLSENILTALSRFSDFFVIARNSTFSYKDMPAEPQQIAQELGVRYIVDGSVQIAGERLRANAQLIDATTGKHLWAEQYDRNLQDIFQVQDEITRTVASTLSTSINLAEYDRLKHQPTESLGAYELSTRAQEHSLRFNKTDNIQAQQLSEQAIALDPDFAGAYAELAWAHAFGYRFGWSKDLSREESLGLALEMARKAIDLEPLNFAGYAVLAYVTMYSGDLDRAVTLYDKALSLNPNSAGTLVDSTDPLVYSGLAEEAVERMRSAIRLNPHHPDWYLWNLGWAQYFAEDYAGALASIEKMNEVPDRLRRTLAPILLRLGREDEAKSMIDGFLEDNPSYSIEEAKKAPFESEEYLNRWLDDLRRLGVPETTR